MCFQELGARGSPGVDFAVPEGPLMERTGAPFSKPSVKRPPSPPQSNRTPLGLMVVCLSQVESVNGMPSVEAKVAEAGILTAVLPSRRRPGPMSAPSESVPPVVALFAFFVPSAGVGVAKL